MDLDAGLDVKPDLDKAPPHVEGELLKRKTRGRGVNILSKAWQKRFFVVHKDKLQYYAKKEDYKSGREPLNSVRLLRVKDITESVFNGVPKRHHINCGFTVIELLPGGEEVVYHLLAETPDLMRYWVHALRYVRSYWSKLEVRDTVLNEDQERKLLERLLKEEESDDTVIVGEYSIDDGIRQGSADWDTKQLCIPVHFGDGSKTLVYVNVNETTSSLIEKVRDKLTSSASQIWTVNNEGKETSLKPDDSVILYHPSAHQFFLVDPNSRVIVVFIGKEFVATIVPLKIAAREVIEYPDIAVKLDIAGITNRGLFLQKGSEELLFDSTECPCEALFSESSDGTIERRDIGHLVVKNKTMEHTSSKILRQSIRKATVIPSSSRKKKHPSSVSIIEEEDHKRALDKVQQLRDGKIKKAPQIVDDSTRVRTRSRAFIKSSESSEEDHLRNELELTGSTDSKSSKSSDTSAPLSEGKGEASSPKPSPRASPRNSPRLSPRRVISTKPSPPPTKRPIKTITKKQVRRAEEIGVEESRSSGFGRFLTVTEGRSESEEERLNNLFSASYQEKEEQELKEKLETKLSLVLESQASNTDEVTDTASESPPSSPPLKPFVLSSSLISQPQSSCVVIHRPALLKVVLLQSEAEDTKDSKQAITRISLSGVVLNYTNGVWVMDKESQFHDMSILMDADGEGDREVYTLPGGIRTVYNTAHNSWTVLPPLALPSPPPLVSSSLPPSFTSPSTVQAEIQNSNNGPDLYTSKRMLATNIGSAFMEILGLFKGSLSLDEKKKIASDMTNESVGHMVRGRFCTSVAMLLLDGVKLQKLGGLIQYDVWKLVTSFCQEGLTLSDPTVTSVAVDTQVMRPIKGESRLVSSDMKFRSFVCLAISRGVFLQWLAELPLLGDTLRKHYGKNSLLYLVYTGDQLYRKLYDEILLSLQPISFFPFQLSIDFEIKSSCSSSLSSSSTGELVREQPVKSNGTITTNGPSQSLSDQDISTEGTDTQPTSLINESHILPSRDIPGTPPPVVTPPPDNGLLLNNPLKGKSAPQWLKSITTNLANLNIGGVLTGPPPAVPPPSSRSSSSPLPNSVPVKPTEDEPLPSQAAPSPPSPPPPSQPDWRVVALYDCSADNEDELSFKKGDILDVMKELDGDWLFCQKDDRRGIVPSLFVEKCT